MAEPPGTGEPATGRLHVSGRLRQRRAWLVLTGLLLSGGAGLPLGWALDAVAARLRIRPVWRAAAAVAWAGVWALAWPVLGLRHAGASGAAQPWGLAWIAAFYAAAGTLWSGRALPSGGAPALAAGWGATALAISAVLPAARSLHRRPWDEQPAREPPPQRPPIAIPDGVDIGTDDARRPALLSDAELNAHALITGATGSGKTNALLLVLESALRRGLPLIVIDGKGSADLRGRLRSLAASSARALEVWSLSGPARYNPLRHGGPTELRDKLIAVERWSEPHYRRAAERYLGALLSALAELGRPVTLRAVADLLLPEALEALARQLPEPRARRLYAYLDALDASSRSAVVGLGNRLATLVESEAGPWLESGPDEAGLDLLDAARGGGALLFSLDSLRYPELAAQLGALLLQDLRTVAGGLLASPERRLCYVAIDEFSAFSGPQVLALLNRGREAGLCCLLATQDLSDVAAAGGPALVDQVLANTNVKLVLRQEVEASAHRLAATLGTRTRWRAGHRVEDGWPTGEATLSESEEPALRPAVLLRLPPYHAVLIKKAPRLIVQRLRLRRAGGLEAPGAGV